MLSQKKRYGLQLAILLILSWLIPSALFLGLAYFYRIATQYMPLAFVLTLCVSVIGTALVFYNYIWKPLSLTNKCIEDEGNIQKDALPAVWQSICFKFYQLKTRTEYVLKTIELLLNERLEDFEKSNTHIQSLPEVTQRLYAKFKEIQTSEQLRQWLNERVAATDNLLRKHLDSDVETLCKDMIKHLCQAAGAVQGGIYLIADEDPSDVHIYLAACYAYDRQKYLTQRIEFGSGLISESIEDKDPIYITDVPENYTTIKSGVGGAKPTCIYIVPIVSNNVSYGAIEFAAFHEFKDHEKEFILQAADHFASTYAALKAKNTMEKLLHEAQEATEVLRAKERDLLENEEKLQQAQDDINQKLIELMAETNLNKSILNAIDKSNATIQFDMNGNILDANTMFLDVMGYSKEDILGKNEEIFLTEEEKNSERYQLLWGGLKEGNFNSGEFKRLTKDGKEVWMDVTYNPILDLNGKPFKILMFANFTTEQKERENEYRNKINTFNEMVGLIELNKNLQLRSVNTYLLDKLKLKRKDIKDKTLFDLLTPANGIDTKTIKEKLEAGEICQTILASKKHPEGEAPIHFHAKLRCVRDIKGEISGIHALLYND